MSDRCPTCNSDRHHGCTRNSRAAEGLKVDADIAQYHRDEVERLKVELKQSRYEGVWSAVSPETLERLLKERTAERDALKAEKLELLGKMKEHNVTECELRQQLANMTGRCDGWYAKYKDTAQQLAEAKGEARCLEIQHEVSTRLYRDLRSRIEALAGRFEKCEVKAAPWLALRALLQPPKAETTRERLIGNLLRNGMITEQQRDILLEGGK